jgi:hypothetical protein
VGRIGGYEEGPVTAIGGEEREGGGDGGLADTAFAPEEQDFTLQ